MKKLVYWFENNKELNDMPVIITIEAGDKRKITEKYAQRVAELIKTQKTEDLMPKAITEEDI